MNTKKLDIERVRLLSREAANATVQNIRPEEEILNVIIESLVKCSDSSGFVYIEKLARITQTHLGQMVEIVEILANDDMVEFSDTKSAIRLTIPSEPKDENAEPSETESDE